MTKKSERGRHCRGEELHNAILTANEVRAIRRRYVPMHLREFKRKYDSIEEIGAVYGIGYSTCKAVLDRRTWKHVA